MTTHTLPLHQCSAPRRSPQDKAAGSAGQAEQAGPADPAANRQPALLRRSRLVALAVGGFLLPWCVLLATTLPATARVQNWSMAWTGLDGGEAIAALATAVLLARADVRAALTAVAGGTLLIADAWFDVCTSAAGIDHGLAVADAIFVELPLASAAFWLAARIASGVGSIAEDARSIAEGARSIAEGARSKA